MAARVSAADGGGDAEAERLGERRTQAVEDGPGAVDLVPAGAQRRIERGTGLHEATADGALGALQAGRQAEIDEGIGHGGAINTRR